MVQLYLPWGHTSLLSSLLFSSGNKTGAIDHPHFEAGKHLPFAETRDRSKAEGGGIGAPTLLIVMHSYVPVPLNATICGLSPALSVSTRSPLAAPVAVGLNSTEIVQVVPAATDPPHVFAETRNGPEVLTLLSVNVALP